MPRRPVDSEGVLSVGYDPIRQWLDIEYRPGGLYRYFGVPDDVHEKLMHAESIGGFVNRQIKPNFRYEEL